MRTPTLRALLATACLMGASGVHAQLACTVTSTPPLTFGSYNPLLFTDHLAQGSMGVRCTGSGYALLRVRFGPGLAGNVGARQMQNGTSRLSYGLYINSARTIGWGDGTSSTIPNYLFVGAGTSGTLQIYGRIPQRQNIIVGPYTDTITVQLDW